MIPTGTAIQNLRAGEFNNPPSDFTRDGYHLDFGCGRYTAGLHVVPGARGACLRTDIGGNTFRPDPKGHTPVTDESAAACQQAARKACVRRFSVWELSRVRRRRTDKGDVSYARLPFFVCRRNGSQKRIFAPTNQLRGSDGP